MTTTDTRYQIGGDWGKTRRVEVTVYEHISFQCPDSGAPMSAERTPKGVRFLSHADAVYSRDWFEADGEHAPLSRDTYQEWLAEQEKWAADATRRGRRVVSVDAANDLLESLGISVHEARFSK